MRRWVLFIITHVQVKAVSMSSPYLVLAAMLLITCLSTTGLLVNRGQTTFPLDIFNLLDVCTKTKTCAPCLPLVSPPQAQLLQSSHRETSQIFVADEPSKWNE